MQAQQKLSQILKSNTSVTSPGSDMIHCRGRRLKTLSKSKGYKALDQKTRYLNAGRLQAAFNKDKVNPYQTHVIDRKAITTQVFFRKVLSPK